MELLQNFRQVFISSLILSVISNRVASEVISDGVQIVTIQPKSLELQELDSFRMEVKVQMVIELSWKERKRNFSNLDFSHDFVMVNDSDFWSPRASIQNGRGVEVVNSIWVLNRDGRHLKTEKISVKLGCGMDFSTYPFDHQRCQIEFGQQFFKVESLQYKIKKRMSSNKENGDHPPPIDIQDVDNFVPQFTLVRAIAFVQNITENQGTHSKVIFSIHVRRHWSSYFSSYFVAISSFVYISLLTLWLVYPKISVMVNFLNIILTNIFLLVHRNALDIPKVYYVTAMSFYSTTCVIFIVLVLLVNVYVLYYIKSEEEDDEEKARRRNAHDLNIRSEVKYFPHPICSSAAAATNSANTSSTQEFQESPPSGSRAGDDISAWVLVRRNLLDRIRRNSHWTLLVTFLLFNFIYWITMICIHYLQ